MRSLFDIPNEILITIFEFLPISTITTVLPSVCSDIKNIIENNEYFWNLIIQRKISKFKKICKDDHLIFQKLSKVASFKSLGLFTTRIRSKLLINYLNQEKVKRKYKHYPGLFGERKPSSLTVNKLGEISGTNALLLWTTESIEVKEYDYFKADFIRCYYPKFRYCGKHTCFEGTNIIEDIFHYRPKNVFLVFGRTGSIDGLISHNGVLVNFPSFSPKKNVIWVLDRSLAPIDQIFLSDDRINSGGNLMKGKFIPIRSKIIRVNEVELKFVVVQNTGLVKIFQLIGDEKTFRIINHRNLVFRKSNIFNIIQSGMSAIKRNCMICSDDNFLAVTFCGRLHPTEGGGSSKTRCEIWNLVTNKIERSKVIAEGKGSQCVFDWCEVNGHVLFACTRSLLLWDYRKKKSKFYKPSYGVSYELESDAKIVIAQGEAYIIGNFLSGLTKRIHTSAIFKVVRKKSVVLEKVYENTRNDLYVEKFGFSYMNLFILILKECTSLRCELLKKSPKSGKLILLKKFDVKYSDSLFNWNSNVCSAVSSLKSTNFEDIFLENTIVQR